MANLTADILADLHIGGVHDDLNKALRDSQERANAIIGSAPCIVFDI